MNIIISKEEFSPTLAKAQSVLERKSTRPILENILLEAYEGRLIISSTDLRVSIRQVTPCRIDTSGSVAVSGRKLHEIVREMPSGTIRLELKDNGWVALSSGKTVFHIPGVIADEYPGLPSTPDKFLSVEASIFRTMLDKTLFATSSDESRPHLCGVYVKTILEEDGMQKMLMVATDGHRLSLSEQIVQGDIIPFENGMILPKKGLSELRALIDGCDSTFDVAYSEGMIFVKFLSTVLTITLIEGKFPNYNQVIPPEVQNKLFVDKDGLIDALKRVSLLSDQETHTVVIEASGEMMVLSSQNSQFGDAREELESEFAGDPLRVAFNAVYLLEAIRSLVGQKVSFSIGDAVAPCLLRGSDDPHHLCVVMPMRLD